MRDAIILGAVIGVSFLIWLLLSGIAAMALGNVIQARGGSRRAEAAAIRVTWTVCVLAGVAAVLSLAP